MSEVFFLLLLQGICCLYSVTLDKLYPCPVILEILDLSFLISISLGFSILVLLSDKLVDEIELDLFTDLAVSSVSVI